MAGSKYEQSIFRNYYAEERPYHLNTVASIIIAQLREDAELLDSKRTQDDADKLTRFFRFLKNGNVASNPLDHFCTSIINAYYEKMIETVIGRDELMDLLGIDFSVSGVEFEKELEKALYGTVSEEVNTIKGTSTATAVLDKITIKGEGESVAEEVNDAIQVLAEAYGKELKEKIINGKDVRQIKIETRNYTSGGEKYTEVRVEVGDLRQGKIDLAGRELLFSITAEENTEMHKVAELLKNSSFSIKSYESNSAIHLGDTNSFKAVTSICSYASERGVPGALDVARFYIRHASSANGMVSHTEENDIRIKQINENYARMRNAYELAGFGLDYANGSNIGESVADFLIVNRASGNDINVYSTKWLIQSRLGEKNRFVKTLSGV